MKYKFFKNVETIEDLRTQYKNLAFKYHPDKGGKTEDMQQVNAEYEDLLKKVRNIHRNAQGKTYKKEERKETPDNFREIINAIINFNIKIEICGAWLWVFGGYEYKKELKDLGFFYCSRKKAWAYTDEEISNNKHKLTLNEIRKIHGSEVIRDKEEQEKLGVAI